MRVVRIKATGRDVRGQRKWTHSARNGTDVTLGCTGVVVERGLVLCPLGAVLRGWEGVAVEVDGAKAASWELLEGRCTLVECVFVLLRCDVDAGTDAGTDARLTVRQYALHLTQPHWGLIVQEGNVVCRPESGVALVDVSCYEGGEGGLVSGGGEEPMVLAHGLRADGAPSGLSVALSIARLLGEPQQIRKDLAGTSPVVVVHGNDGRWGTGFAVGPGVVMTAAHVICPSSESPPQSVTVLTEGRRWQTGKMVHCWPGGWLDLCVVQVDRDAPVSILRLRESVPAVRERVQLLSATQWNGAPMKTEGGIIAVVMLAQLVSNAIAFGGCSGGPLLDSDGSVVGLLVSTASRGKTRIPRLSLYLPSTLLLPFLREDPRPPSDELRSVVEPVWRLALPPLPPKFGAFQKSML